MERLKDKVKNLTSVWKKAGITLFYPLPFIFKTAAVPPPRVHMKGQLMVTPQGREAKEDKTKTKRKKEKAMHGNAG